MKRILFICAFLLSFMAVETYAQTSEPFTLQGVVVDTNGEPIVGAMVYVKDKPGVGTLTDAEGEFSIKVDMYNTIGVSFVGYDPVEQVITAKTKVVITMKEGIAMDEVVVVGMGTQRKVSVTGAIASVDTKSLERPAMNIVNTLGGRVPGVISMQASGEPGRNISEFWVRGIGTFGANSGALVLIDGLEGTLSQIDPADVENFSVLKDAAVALAAGKQIALILSLIPRRSDA